MGDIVNLRLERKRKAREENERAATLRRASFGRTKSEKAADRLERELDTRRLDAHRLTPGDEPRDDDLSGR